jgi:prevent-host-death family protein
MINFNIKFNILKEGFLMEKVSILEFRRDAESVIRKVRQGKRLILTHRGKPVMRLEPIREDNIRPDDPFYTIAELAVPNERSLTNEEIDQIVYES